jgi:hypothetical protein
MHMAMSWKRKVGGGILGIVGFMLSPLSWWNDLFVNVPLALAFAWLVSLLYRPAFEVSLIVGYWLTNVLGFALMHKGARWLRSPEEATETKRELVKDLGISLAYTAFILILIKLDVLKPIEAYFQGR